jgi:putative redox protein
MIATWASRFVETEKGEEAGDLPDGAVRVAETGQGKFQQVVRSGSHRLTADEPADMGGEDSGPSPYDFLSIALGACTSMTLRLYAGRKKMALDKVSVDVFHDKVHAEDCEECEDNNKRIDRFERVILLEGDLSREDREKLIEIADKCPVHRTLEQSSRIVTREAVAD